MDNTTREIYKSALIKGMFGKYNGKKESLLAEITYILEGNNSGLDLAESFEDKVTELAACENIIAQLEIMFAPGAQPQGAAADKECCGDKESCSEE